MKDLEHFKKGITTRIIHNWLQKLKSSDSFHNVLKALYNFVTYWLHFIQLLNENK